MNRSGSPQPKQIHAGTAMLKGLKEKIRPLSAAAWSPTEMAVLPLVFGGASDFSGRVGFRIFP
jgi:hypothetical protein